MELFSRMKMVSIVLWQKAKRNQKPEAQMFFFPLQGLLMSIRILMENGSSHSL